LTSQEKRESEWLFVSHLPVASLEIKRECWFLQEPPVVHVRCRTLEAAEGMLALAQMGGLKRSGLVSFKKLVLEIKSAEKMETFVTPGLDREYVSLLLEKANEKLLRGRRNLEMFEKGLRRVF